MSPAITLPVSPSAGAVRTGRRVLDSASITWCEGITRSSTGLALIREERNLPSHHVNRCELSTNRHRSTDVPKPGIR